MATYRGSKGPRKMALRSSEGMMTLTIEDKDIIRLISYRLEEVTDALRHITRDWFDCDVDVDYGSAYIFQPTSGPDPDPIVWEYELKRGLHGLEQNLLETIGSYIYAFDVSAPKNEEWKP